MKVINKKIVVIKISFNIKSNGCISFWKNHFYDLQFFEMYYTLYNN